MSQSSKKTVAVIGSGLETVGTLADWGVAGFGKLGLPAVTSLDQAVRRTEEAYTKAIAEVQISGGDVYGWMHSEGAIHGQNTLAKFDQQAWQSIRIVTLGGAEYGFDLSIRQTHHMNYSGNKKGVTGDPIPGAVAGSWRPASLPIIRHIPFVRQAVLNPQKQFVSPHYNVRRVVTDYSRDAGESSTYVHGFPTYAETAILPEAKDYFTRNAKQILGH